MDNDSTNSQSWQDMYKEFCLIDAAFGGVHKRNRVIRREELRAAAKEYVKHNGKLYKEMYITYFRYPAEFLEHFNTVIRDDSGKVIKHKKSVALYKGRHYSDYFIVDIDDEDDPSKALFAARKFLRMLQSTYNYDLKALRVFFSGYKGFHIEIPSVAFGLKPSTSLNETYRYIIGKFGVPFDTSVYDNIRLWRLPNTINAKSGFYKIPLSADELLTLSISKIQELAKKPRKGITFDDNVGLNPELHKLYVEAVENAGKQESQPGDKRKAYKDFFKDGAGSGGRHESIISVAGMLKARGLPLEDTKALCLSLNQSHNKPPKKESLIIADVEDVYKRYPNDDKDDVDEPTAGTDKDTLPQVKFPFDVFPPALRAIANRIGAAIRIEPEVAFGIMLSLVSGAIGNKIRVSPKKRHLEPPFIWLIIVAPSGYGKSPAFRELARPFEELQAKAHIEYKQKDKEYRSALRKEKVDPSIDVGELPVEKHYYFSNTTVEALAKELDTNPKGLVGYQDELSGFILGLNQYKGGAGNDRQLYITLWDCGQWKIDRVSKNNTIPNTGAAIIGGIQPKIMPDVLTPESFDDGLLPRFVFINANKKPGGYSREEITDDDAAYWKELINWCLGQEVELNEIGTAKHTILKLSAEGVDLWEKFNNEYTTLTPFLSENAQVFIPKLMAYGLKFMGVLYTMHTFDEQKRGEKVTEVTEVTVTLKKKLVEDAIKLTRYFAGQAIKTLDVYKPSARPLTEFEVTLVKAIRMLEDSVKGGRLPLSEIVRVFNSLLPDKKLEQGSEKVSSLLRKGLGLSTKRGTEGYRYLLWEEEKIKGLYLRATVTTVTTATEDGDAPAESSHGDAYEPPEASVDGPDAEVIDFLRRAKERL